jgi:hypothetical protein
MKDYRDFPPQKYFLRVLKNCPQSALIYTQLWKKRGTFMKLMTQKKDVRKEYLISPTLFRNLLAPLMFLNLVSFVENDERFEIEILGPNIND